MKSQSKYSSSSCILWRATLHIHEAIARISLHFLKSSKTMPVSSALASEDSQCQMLVEKFKDKITHSAVAKYLLLLFDFIEGTCC